MTAISSARQTHTHTARAAFRRVLCPALGLDPSLPSLSISILSLSKARSLFLCLAQPLTPAESALQPAWRKVLIPDQWPVDGPCGWSRDPGEVESPHRSQIRGGCTVWRLTTQHKASGTRVMLYLSKKSQMKRMGERIGKGGREEREWPREKERCCTLQPDLIIQNPVGRVEVCLSWNSLPLCSRQVFLCFSTCPQPTLD